MPERVWADFEANYGLADQFRFMERQGTVRCDLLAEGEPFELGGYADHADPARRRERARVPLRGRRQARPDRDGRDARLDAARLGALDLAVLPVGVFEHHPVHRRADDPGGVLQAAGAEDALREALEMAGRSARGATILSHVEEMDRLSHDELERLGAADGWEPAYDGLLESTAVSADTILRRQRAGFATSEPAHLGR